MKFNLHLKSRRTTHSGFTIIELLVAVGITALLVTLMLTIVSNVLSGWNRSAGSLSSGNQARTILTQVSEDLQSLLMKRDGNVWLVANIQPDQLTQLGDAQVKGENWTAGVAANIKPVSNNGSSMVPYYIKSTQANVPTAVPDLSSYRFGQAGIWLRFFTNSRGANTVVNPATNQVDLSTVSAPRAVAYQLIRSKLGGEYGYQFLRSESRPGPEYSAATGSDGSYTFKSGYDLSATGNPSYNSGNDGAIGNVGNIRRPLLTQLLANNVIDFGIRAWVKNPATGNLNIVFPNSINASSTTPRYLGFAITTKSVTAAPSATDEDTTAAFAAFPPGTPYVAGFPEVIEVFVRILTDEGARQISNFEAGNIQAPTGVTAANYWWTIALANSNVYTRRIEIKAQAF